MQSPSHTVVHKATVRADARIKSLAVGTMQPGQHVSVLETTKQDGHIRALVGPGQWISSRTKLGRDLLVPFAPQAAVYTVVNKTVVRSESSVKSKVVTELEPGATIVVLEETQRDGHHRARIGNKEWVSLRTAKGSILAIAAATVTAVSAAPVVAAVVAAQPCPTAATTIAAQSFASTVDVEVEQLQQHATPTASAQPAAGSAAMHATTGHLGLPPAAAAPLPLVGSAGQLTNLVAPGLPYTMVANATVRAGPSVSSPATAKGKMLAIPGFVADLQSAAATVVAQPAAVYAAPVMAQPMHVTVVGTSVAAQPVQLAAPAAASVAIVTAAPTAAAPAADAPVPGSTPGR